MAPKNTEDDDNEDDKPDPGSQSSEETLTGLLGIEGHCALACRCHVQEPA